MEKVSKYGDGSNNKELIITDKFGNVKSIFQKKISLTTLGTSGPSTFINNILNVPDYSGALSGYVPTSRTLTINGTTYDLSANRTWNVGTVTSIATTGPITGGTITGSGTIGITQATTSTDGYLSSTDWNTFNNKQNAITLTTVGSSGPATLIGSTLNIPNYSTALTGYVPYIGATQNVDLGEYQLKVGQIEFDQTPTGTPGVAIMRWNDQDGTVDLGLKGGNVTLQIGQEQLTRVVNKTGGNLLEANYQSVRISGAQGNRLKVALAQANNDANSAETLGIVTETINDNQEGFITTSGLVRNINTTGSLQGETWADGDMLYLSGTVAGQLTNIKPTAPIHTVIMGYVVRAHATQGQIYVKVDNGYELDELHNVAISSPLNNQGLFYETATQLWKNKSIDTALGYTPVPTTRQLTINGTTYDLSANRTWSVGTITSVTASAPLSSSGGNTPNITISQATGSTNGYLSAADWTTFNSKQPAGNYITALSGEASASGPGTASVTLNNASVTAKILTGVNITGGSINASDSILTAFGKLQNQINGLIGSSVYQGTWNASTNTPALASGVGTRGYYYIVSVAGSTNLDGITDWNVGDWAIFDGTAWQQVDNTDSVTSVNGQTGAVSLTTDNIPEGATNLYFTNLRARQSLSLTTTGTSGAATYNNTTGVLNIPQYQSVITNPVTGTGTTNYVARWTSSSQIGTGVLYDNGTNVGIGTENPWFPASGRRILSINGTSSALLEFHKNGVLSGYIYSTDSLLEISGGDSAPQTFLTSNSERMRITTSGNIGIGTSAPSAALHVARTNGVIFGSNAGNTGTLQFTTDIPGSPVSGRMLFGTDLTGWQFRIARNAGGSITDLFTIQDNGNVGIGAGATNPGFKLQVDGTGFFNDYIFIANGSSLRFTTNSIFIKPELSGGFWRDLSFSTGAVEQMRLTGSGNLGLGTTAPIHKLSVVGKIGGSVFGDSYIEFPNTGNTILKANDNVIVGYLQDTIFTQGGNVGIGSLGPNSLLSATERVLLIENSNLASLYLSSLAGRKWSMSSAGDGALVWWDLNAVTERMRINSSGNVGIGTSSPAYKLTVAGRTYVDQLQYVQGIQISGANLNDYTDAGFYAGSGLGNAPDPYGWYYVTIERHSDATWVHQTATSYGAGNTGNRIYSRVREAGVWGAWKELADSASVSGTTNYVSKFTSSNTIGNSLIYDNGTNVGIGTASPSYKLDVAGDIHVQSSSLVGTVYFGNSGQNYLSYYSTDSYYRANGNHYFEGNGFYKGVWDSNSYLGIGNTNPTQLVDIGPTGAFKTLRVRGTYNFDGSYLASAGANGGAKLELVAHSDFSTSASYRIQHNRDVTTALTFDFASPTTSYAGLSYVERMRIDVNGNVGIGTTNPTQRLEVSGNIKLSSTVGSTSTPSFIWLGNDFSNGNTRDKLKIYLYNSGTEQYGFTVGSAADIQYHSNGTHNFYIGNTFSTSINSTGIGIGTSTPTQPLHVNGSVRVAGAYYDSNNQAGTSGQILSSTGSGTDWVDSPTATATSVAQLLPSATVTYNWVGQVVNGTWVDIFTRANNVLTSGVWTVTMYVSDFGQGGAHYQYRYSGTMTWYQGGTNQTGIPAASEIALHRMGHAANDCILYLRTTEEAASDGGNGKLQIKGNYTNTSNTTITFTFVKII